VLTRIYFPTLGCDRAPVSAQLSGRRREQGPDLLAGWPPADGWELATPEGFWGRLDRRRAAGDPEGGTTILEAVQNWIPTGCDSAVRLLPSAIALLKRIGGDGAL
jgi:hypothetical protein